MSHRILQCLWMALVLLVPASARAGPWSKDPGHWYFKLGQSLFTADGFRDAEGRFNTESSYLGLNTFAYGEVGLVEGLQTQFYLPFTIGINSFDEDSTLRLSTRCENGLLVNDTSRRSFGDASAGLQYSPKLMTMPHALRADVKLPLYDLADPRGACRDLFPQPGDGQLDITLWLSLGDSFHPRPFYLYGELGHRFRTEVFIGEATPQQYGDTFVFFGQAGWEFTRGAFLQLNLQLSLPYVDDSTTKGSVVLGPALFVPLEAGFAVETEVQFTPWASNSAEGVAEALYWTSVSVGISHKH